MFLIQFDSLMSSERFQVRRTQLFSAMRLLEFSVYATQGHNASFILHDGIEAYAAFRSLVPARVCS